MLEPEMLEPEMHAPLGDAIPAGPLPPTWSAPAYWRATLSAGAVQRLEARFGWAHRGILGLMRGKSPAGAARFVTRIDGTAPVAHATAFARAVEAALELEPPLAARGLRALMLSLERAAIALHDLSATAGALGQPCPAAAHARARILAACATLFGHRLMFDAVRPGGVAADPSSDALRALDDTLATLPALHVHGPLAACAGARAAAATAAIDSARTHLANLPAGSALAPLPHTPGPVEGLASAEGPHGPIWHWVRLTGGTVAANFAADPFWLRLPVLEAAAVGHPLASVSPRLAAAGLHPAGMDL